MHPLDSHHPHPHPNPLPNIHPLAHNQDDSSIDSELFLCVHTLCHCVQGDPTFLHTVLDNMLRDLTGTDFLSQSDIYTLILLLDMEVDLENSQHWKTAHALDLNMGTGVDLEQDLLVESVILKLIRNGQLTFNLLLSCFNNDSFLHRHYYHLLVSYHVRAPHFIDLHRTFAN